MPNAGEIIQLHVGQAGVQIANACWELYCLEHGISAEGCLYKYPEDESYETFFWLGSGLKVVPRLVMVDSEPTVIDEIRSGSYSNLFHPDTLVTGKEDSGSSFARGYYTTGEEMIDYVMDGIRQVAENCQNLRGFLMFRSIGGGTGSGLGNLILERCHEDYGKLPRLEFIIFPSPSLSPLVVEPYNAILATHMGLDISDCSFIMDNEALYDICARKLKVASPTYTNLNRIIGQIVSTFTASQRFTGCSNISFTEFHTNLVPYPRIHFPLLSYAPFNTNATGSMDKFSTQQITNECFSVNNQLIRCVPSQGKYMACALIYRGEVTPSEVNTAIRTIKTNNSTRFVDWSPSGFKVAINNMLPTNVPGSDLSAYCRSVLALSNNSAIVEAWCRLMNKYNKLISRRAFIHHYIQEGMEESMLHDASSNVCTLIQDYQKVTAMDRMSLSDEVKVSMESKISKGSKSSKSSKSSKGSKVSKSSKDSKDSRDS